MVRINRAKVVIPAALAAVVLCSLWAPATLSLWSALDRNPYGTLDVPGASVAEAPDDAPPSSIEAPLDTDDWGAWLAVRPLATAQIVTALPESSTPALAGILHTARAKGICRRE